MITNSNDSKNLSNEKNMNPKKLLIIGNGFDLHQNLKSSFKDFFKSTIFKEKSTLNDDKSNTEDFFDVIASINNNLNRQFSNPSEFIKYSTEFQLKNVDINRDFKISSNTNFWSLYFTNLKRLSDLNSKNDIFTMPSMTKKLSNWSDIEYQIQYLLTHTENVLNKYIKCLKIDDKKNSIYDIKQTFINYESSMLGSNEEFTFDGAISLMTIKFALDTGWNSSAENIYKHLFNQLIKFENIFGDYLKCQVKNAKKNNNYTEKSQQFAKNLVNHSNYNLLNFNYTTFYNINNPDNTNIHSTLEEGGHPIFGISSDLGNNELIYQKPYYRFSKAYRIMKLANYNSIKNTLPQNIDEIIFYGQSLSHADYLYFDTIFSEYKIYDNDSNIKLTFKYSNFDTTTDIEQHEINIVYKLINQFAKHINMYNLLTKLLLDNRLNIEEIPEDNSI